MHQAVLPNGNVPFLPRRPAGPADRSRDHIRFSMTTGEGMSTAGHPLGVEEPIAVIGLSCRLPGAADPDAFWQLLRRGGDAVVEVPADRWPEAAAEDYRRGGFLAEVDRFDAAFFGIPRAEAAAMDPQQRLALELAWEALERARIAPTSLRDSGTAVVVGAINGDYAALHERVAPGPYTLTGVLRS